MIMLYKNCNFKRDWIRDTVKSAEVATVTECKTLGVSQNTIKSYTYHTSEELLFVSIFLCNCARMCWHLMFERIAKSRFTCEVLT